MLSDNKLLCLQGKAVSFLRWCWQCTAWFIGGSQLIEAKKCRLHELPVFQMSYTFSRMRYSFGDKFYVYPLSFLNLLSKGPHQWGPGDDAQRKWFDLAIFYAILRYALRRGFRLVSSSNDCAARSSSPWFLWLDFCWLDMSVSTAVNCHIRGRFPVLLHHFTPRVRWYGTTDKAEIITEFNSENLGRQTNSMMLISWQSASHLWASREN